MTNASPTPESTNTIGSSPGSAFGANRRTARCASTNASEQRAGDEERARLERLGRLRVDEREDEQHGRRGREQEEQLCGPAREHGRSLREDAGWWTRANAPSGARRRRCRTACPRAAPAGRPEGRSSIEIVGRLHEPLQLERSRSGPGRPGRRRRRRPVLPAGTPACARRRSCRRRCRPRRARTAAASR